MNIKSTVRFRTINWYGVQFFAAVLKVELLLGLPITISSGNDSNHDPKGYHPLDQAWDIRINDVSKEQAEARQLYLATELGYGWDVIIERYELDHQRDHIHAERDTRKYPDKIS